MRTALLVLSLGLGALACDGARPRPSGNPGSITPTPTPDGGVRPPADAGFDDAGRPVDAGPLPDAGFVDAGDGRADGGRTTDGGGNGSCPAHLGLREVGQRWTARSTAAYQAQYQLQYTTTSELVSSTEVDGATEVVVTLVQDVSGTPNGQVYSAHSEGRTVYRCGAEGAALALSTFVTSGVSGETPFTSDSQTTYDPPLFMAPHDPFAVGSWSGASDQTTAGVSNGQSYSNTTPVTRNATALGRTPYEVPAGTFDAIVIHVDWGNSEALEHYAEGVGYLGSETQELVSYE